MQRIVTIDIENFANLMWSWVPYGQNWSAVDTEYEWHILCFAAKWYGEPTKVYALDDYKGYKPMLKRKGNTLTVRKPDEKKLLQEIWNILDEADIVIGWNSKRFDIKKIQSKLLQYGFKPPRPFIQIDVMQEKKKLTQSNSNKLDATGQEWGLGRKLEHTGWELWMGCAEGDKKAWATMKKYNKIDVDLTEATYDYLKPWMKTHPNLAVGEERPACTRGCGTNVRKRGPEIRANGMVQRWSCNVCKGNMYTSLKGKMPLKST